jgi:hypothetical protein
MPRLTGTAAFRTRLQPVIPRRTLNFQVSAILPKLLISLSHLLYAIPTYITLMIVLAFIIVQGSEVISFLSAPFDMYRFRWEQRFFAIFDWVEWGTVLVWTVLAQCICMQMAWDLILELEWLRAD